MGMLKFDVPHSLPKDEVKKRLEQLIKHWGAKHGITASWQDTYSARVAGKVMGISIDADLLITDQSVGGEATDPGFLFREKAKRYLTEKFAFYLDAQKSVDDLSRNG